MSDIRAIEQRRLHELEKKAAHFGANTDPATLIEIDELRHRYPAARRKGRINHADLDFDILMSTTAAALKRLTVLEESAQADSAQRARRQRRQDWWMAGMSALMLFTVLMLLVLLI